MTVTCTLIQSCINHISVPCSLIHHLDHTSLIPLLPEPKLIRSINHSIASLFIACNIHRLVAWDTSGKNSNSSSTYPYLRTYTRTLYIHIHTYICIRVCEYAYIYIYKYTFIHTNIHRYIYIY